MTNHKQGASQHGPRLITLFTGNCQVETLFSSDIIMKRNKTFLLFLFRSKHHKHRLRAVSLSVAKSVNKLLKYNNNNNSLILILGAFYEMIKRALRDFYL